MIKKLIGNSIIYGLAPNVPKLAALFILPVLTKYLTENDFGIAGTIVAYTLALSSFSTLGFNVVLQNIFFKQRSDFKLLWRDVYGFLQIWMIVFSIIQSVILFFIIPAEAEPNRWWIIGLSNFNGVIFGPSGFIGALYYQLQEKPIPIAIRSLISGFLTLIINYITIVNFKLGYMGWYISSFLGGFFINFSYWLVLSKKLNLKPNYKFNKHFISDKLRVALPTIPHYYSVFLIQTSGRLVMDWGKIGLGPIGIYNIAHQITSYVDAGIQAIEKAASPPSIKGIQDNQEHITKRYVFVFVILTFALTFYIALWSREIFKILIKNDALANSYPYASILIMALCYRPMYFAVSNLYFYYEETKKILYITFFAGICAFIANICVIPHYGVGGAVIINYIVFLYQGYSGFIIYNLVKEKSKVHYPYKQILFFQLLLTAIVVYFLNSAIVVKFSITIVTFLIFSYFAWLVLIKKYDSQN